MAQAKRDGNFVPTLIGVSDVDDETPVNARVDATNKALHVQLVASDVAIGGGTEYTEGDTDATFTGGVILAEGPSNTATPLQVDSSKLLQVDIAADSVGIGGGTQYTEDAAAAADPVGTAINLVRDDARGGSLTTTDGDNVAARGTNAGELYVKHVDSIAVTNAGLTELAAAINGSSQLDINIAASGIDVMLGTDFSDVFGAASLILATQADDVANTSDGLQTSSFGYMYDGATWDRVRGTSADGLLVNLGSNNDVTVTGSLTSAGDVTNAGTFAVQESGSALTALQLLDDAVYVDDADWTDNTSKHLLVGGVYQSSPHTVTDGDVSPFLIDANGRLVVAATDNGGSLTVDGTITANLSTTDNDVLDAIAASVAAIDTDATTIIGHVDGLEGLLTTIDSDTGGIVTSVQLIDDTVFTAGTDTYAEATSKGLLMLAVRRDADTTLANTTNEFVPFQVDANGYLKVEIFDGGGSHTVDNNGTFAVQVDGNALTALQLIDDVVYVDDADWTADTSKHTLVGGVTQTTPTANTDGDVTPLITNNLRELRIAALESDLATAGTAHVKKYYTNAGSVTDGIIWSPAAGKRWFLTHLSINVSAAATVTIEDDLAGGDSPVYKAEFAANSGVVLTFPEVPMFSGEDAADLLVTTSAGNVYITAVGYEI